MLENISKSSDTSVKVFNPISLNACDDNPFSIIGSAYLSLSKASSPPTKRKTGISFNQDNPSSSNKTSLWSLPSKTSNVEFAFSPILLYA